VINVDRLKSEIRKIAARSRGGSVFTKNLDAKRRNEELGRSAPEPLFCSPRTGPRSWTKDGFSAFHALFGGRWTDNGGRLLKKRRLSRFLSSDVVRKDHPSSCS